ncbi:hypothetical protein CEK62_04355 [Alcanivorax sp. N3-2A]|nr:hypothetical protein CEK62_04355 [Alcanivorax sp. N3-2A]
MSFELTKLLGALVMPLPTILILLIFGLLFLYVGRGRKFGIFLISFATLYLFVVSAAPFSRDAVISLENNYSMLKDPPQAAKWIIVLGGGVHDDPSLPPLERLTIPSRERLREGMRIYRKLPHAKLILSGGFPNVKPDSITTADAMANIAVRWGIPESDIVLSRFPVNTAAEAKAATKWVKEDEMLIVVTSAVHMPRAMALFDKQGFAAVPAPTEPSVKEAKEPKYAIWARAMPQASNVELAEKGMRETVGYWYARLRGQAGPRRGD